MMDTTERARLRALCEEATPGPECTGIFAQWCPRCGDCTCPDGVPADCPLCPLHAASSPHGEDEEHGPDTAALLRLGDEARTALPALLDALDAAERERDEARAGRALSEELACAIGIERDILRRERDEARAEAERLRASEASRREFMPAALDAVRKVAREEERELCADIADEHAVQEDVAGADVCGRVADAIRARGAGGER